LKHDLGFQLSFLAVLGLIYLCPIIDNYLHKIFSNKFIWLKEILSATLSAQIAVTPFLLSVTQGFSLSSIFTNILIVPIMPFCLGLGFIYSFIFFVPVLGKVMSFISFPLISYLNIVIDIFSSLPFSYFYISFPLYFSFIVYILLAIFVIKKGRERSLNFLSNNI
jgi:competence protein ComEC